MGFRKAKYTPEQIKEIKKVVKENDITEGYSLEPEVDLSPDKADIFNRTKKIFAQYWKDNLKGLGINQSMKNFSKDHPVNFLMSTDSNIIGEIVSEASDIFDGNTDYSKINYNEFFSILTENVEDEKATAILKLYKNTIDAELNRFAKNAGKDVSELWCRACVRFFWAIRTFDTIRLLTVKYRKISRRRSDGKTSMLSLQSFN